MIQLIKILVECGYYSFIIFMEIISQHLCSVKQIFALSRPHHKYHANPIVTFERM